MLSLRFRETPTAEIMIRSAEGKALARIPPELRQQMQYLWTRLEVHDGDIPRSIAVTSHLSGEGVSFVSRALGSVLSRLGRTCLVEANWWGEGIGADMSEGGLVDVLQGGTTVDRALVPTDHPNLWILPAGNLAAAGGAVSFNAEGQQELLDQLHERFDLTILDLPAITTSSVALSLTAVADSSLLVVRQRVTRIDQVESAINDLRHTRLLGVVVNNSRLRMPRFLQRYLLSER